MVIHAKIQCNILITQQEDDAYHDCFINLILKVILKTDYSLISTQKHRVCVVVKNKNCKKQIKNNRYCSDIEFGI